MTAFSRSPGVQPSPQPSPVRLSSPKSGVPGEGERRFARLHIVVCIGGLVCLLLCASARGQSANASVDLDSLRQSFTKSLLPSRQADIDELNHQADHRAGELRPDGTWADIDYDDKTRSAWKTAEHLSRTLTMAQSARARE